jgi:DNA-directed RNA polymerase specialized sigma24 family protein
MDLDVHLAAIAQGDVDAFGAWVAGAERPLRDALRSFAAQVDTEAVLQEALLRVWQLAPRIGAGDGRPDSPLRPNALLRFALRVARNLAISEWRRLSRSEPTEPQTLEAHADAIASEAAAPDPLLRARIEQCRDQLPKKPALALAARLESGGREPDEQLAERLSMRTNTFVQNVARARQFLARCLEAHGIVLAARSSHG